eukprot:6353198-Lingulodinium_polyedra.AAC.1
MAAARCGRLVPRDVGRRARLCAAVLPIAGGNVVMAISFACCKCSSAGVLMEVTRWFSQYVFGARPPSGISAAI